MPMEILRAGRVAVVEGHAYRGALVAGQVDEVDRRRRRVAAGPADLGGVVGAQPRARGDAARGGRGRGRARGGAWWSPRDATLSVGPSERAGAGEVVVAAGAAAARRRLGGAGRRPAGGEGDEGEHRRQDGRASHDGRPSNASREPQTLALLHVRRSPEADRRTTTLPAGTL